MKKNILILIVMFSIFSFLQTTAQVTGANFTWSCYTGGGAALLAGTNDVVYTFPASGGAAVGCQGNGFVAEVVGTGALQAYQGVLPGGNPYLRLVKVGAAPVFSYASLYSVGHATLFTLTGISITPSTATSQTITMTAYKGGVAKGSVNTGAVAAVSLVNFNAAQLAASFTNIDEIRFTSDLPAAFGVGIDNLTTAGTILPISLMNFSAALQDTKAFLTWQTASEINSDYFNVQRSTDGLNFSTIGKIAAAKNSISVNAYNYVDAFNENQQQTNNLYYRLQEIDQDGSFTYSDVRTINLPQKNSIVYPNPATNTLFLRWPYLDAVSITAVIINNEGKIVKQENTPLAYPLQISLLGLTSGTYFIYCIDDKQHTSGTQSFVKLPD
jgi:hypothetical protein